VTLSIPGSRRGNPPRARPSKRRRELVDALLEALAFNVGERMAMFRSWHRVQLSLVHIHVLTMLAHHGPMAMGKLAEALDVSVASATGIVDRLEARDMVRRRRSNEDRRVVLVEPTEGAAGLFDEMEAERRTRLRSMLEELTDDELTGFLGGLQAFHAARERHVAALPAAETSHPRHGRQGADR
jgi:DNA-binding MarR family transcriptional regulator